MLRQASTLESSVHRTERQTSIFSHTCGQFRFPNLPCVFALRLWEGSGGPAESPCGHREAPAEVVKVACFRSEQSAAVSPTFIVPLNLTPSYQTGMVLSVSASSFPLLFLSLIYKSQIPFLYSFPYLPLADHTAVQTQFQCAALFYVYSHSSTSLYSLPRAFLKSWVPTLCFTRVAVRSHFCTHAHARKHTLWM